MSRKDVSDLQVCQAYADCRLVDFKRDGQALYPDTLLMERTGQPWKVCYRAMERAQDHGLIECGVSLRAGWLTDPGVELLWQ